MTPSDLELELLDLSDDPSTEPITSARDAETAPLISADALIQEGYPLKQYTCLGRLISVHRQGNSFVPDDPRIYCNTNAPFSAVICGVQGGGKVWFFARSADRDRRRKLIHIIPPLTQQIEKSHTVATMLESMLLPDERIGLLPSPLSALVMHFGEGGHASKPCEAAFVGRATDPKVVPPKVVVFCSPSAFKRMSQVYDRLGSSIRTYPLYFFEEDIDASSLLSMMAVSETGTIPLYMHAVLQVLGELGENYTFQRFQSDLKSRGFDALQTKALEQRLALLESFLCTRIKGMLYSVKGRKPIEQPADGKFAKGRLTIVDLTDHLINAGSACSLFEIVLKLFNREDVGGTGKLVILDEAHKYLSETGQGASEGSKRLTDRVLSFTRQQRHLAMRVIISTQEPTVVPARILDLCSMIICHRFSSNGWWQHLAKHVSTDLNTGDTFDRVVKLRTGEALVFCPKAIVAQRVTAGEEHGLDQVIPATAVSEAGSADWDGLPLMRTKMSEDSPESTRPVTPKLLMDFEEAQNKKASVEGDKEKDEEVRDLAHGVASIEISLAEHSRVKAELLPRSRQFIPTNLDRGYLLVKTRKRITADGGQSVLATQ